MALISCEGVSMAYGGHVVLTGINFNVEMGNYICVVGENGSGKSTLAKGLLRLMPPASGRITYGDGLVSNRVGYIPQRSPAGADFPAGVYEVVISGCLARRGFMPFYSKNDRQNAIYNMKRLDIESLKDKCFGELSGGQQQRVLLARALCSAGSLLILDEPTAGLDPMAAQDFYDIIDELHSRGDMAIVMISHDVGRALSGATHVLHIGCSQEFFGAREAYLASAAGRKFTGMGEESGAAPDA
ncbi:MAG: metal ABC transporter ATP-binding protein [Synergistaceae bacterium]|jgi:zinc transport system ATP-binding protein|nr:metal ABC transporter ATP-binding protein [Synergistaceae bacterium]